MGGAKRSTRSTRSRTPLLYTTPKYRSNSNDGRSEAYLWFSVSYLRYKNINVTNIKISFNIGDNLLVY